MLRRIPYILALSSIFIFLLSCTDDGLSSGSGGTINEEQPVEFTFMFPDNTMTRGIENPKTKFSNGDVIHIEGTFDTEYDGIKGKVVRYGAMTYNGKKWEAAPGSMLTWPTTSTGGKFKAYFVSGSTGVLYHTTPSNEASKNGEDTENDKDTQTDFSKTAIYELAGLTPNTDPLEAISDYIDRYGHAVALKFTHICAYLTMDELEPMVSDTYWFKGTLKSGKPFNNAFYLTLNEDNTLSFTFCQKPDAQYNNLVYISSPAILVETSGKNITKANFFLEPGFYENFTLSYPSTAPDIFEYIEYDYNNVPRAPGDEERKSKEPDFKANTPYTLNITKAPGISIILPPDGDGWDETDLDYKVNVKEFLRAVANGTDYTNDNNIKILEKTATGTQLLHNVDFEFAKYPPFTDADTPDESFEYNVNNGQTFDGGFHYIKNLGCPLFYNNHGTIRNLGIKNIKAKFISDKNDNATGLDMSRQGGLCMWNRSTGTIENIRVEEMEITALVKTDTDQETHNIGCVIGSNSGVVKEVSLFGTFEMIVEAYEGDGYTDQVDATVLIGGFVGQNAGEGTISDVTPRDNNLTINIINKCQGDIGAFYVGGIVGQNSGHINEVVLPNVTVDGTASKGITSYMGCMAGELTTDNAASASLTSCIVSGTVKAGVVNPSSNSAVQSVSYAGGFAGALMNVPITGCRVTASVYGTAEKADNVIYATGGAFGRIRTTTDMNNLIAYCTSLNGQTEFIGNFAGIVPQGHTWEDYAEKSIIVRQFDDYENIGTDRN